MTGWAVTKRLICLISVLQIPKTENYWALAEVVEYLRAEAEAKMKDFLDTVARWLMGDDVKVTKLVKGSRPATTIVERVEEGDYHLILLASNGRGTFERMIMDSDLDRVVASTNRSVLMMPSRNNR